MVLTVVLLSLAGLQAQAVADVDTTPPALVSASPASETKGVLRNAVVVATFDEALDAASVNNDALTLECAGQPVTGHVSYSTADGPQVLFTPTTQLPSWVWCTATLVDGGIRDLAQNANVGTISWRFKTKKVERTLTVAKNGAGSGRVYGASALPPASPVYGIDCGAQCSTQVLAGHAYVLGAAPARGSRFIKWIDCPQPQGAECVIPQMNTNRAVTAVFWATGSDDLHEPAHWPTSSWQHVMPESQGFLPGSMFALAGEARAALPYHTSVLVIKNGYIVHESYNSPEGSFDVDENTKHHIWSVTKSVMSLTFGAAWRNGDIRPAHLDKTAEQLFPALVSDLPADAGQRNISLRDVLQMRSGLNWSDIKLFAFAESPMFVTHPACAANENSMLCTILHREQSYEPGAVWNYSTMDSYVAAAFFRKLTGTSLHDYAATHLFAPLGIDYSFGDWYRWPLSSSNTFGGGLLYMKSRDVAKIGMLALYDGRWDGVQRVGKNWQALALAQQPDGPYATYDDAGNPLPLESIPSGDIPYGMQWWLGNVMGEPSDGTITARGLGGQLIHIYPDRELVVVVTCDDQELTNRFPAIHAFVQSAIVDRLGD